MFRFPVVGHVFWPVRLDAVSRTIGRLPNAGEVVAWCGSGFSPGLNASTTGRPQPSRRTGPDLSEEAFCPRTSSDAASTATNMNAEAT